MPRFDLDFGACLCQKYVMDAGSLKTHSENHRRFIRSLFEKIGSHYASKLVSLCVYGSYAEGKNRLDSDLDLLIVLKAPWREGRLQRQENFYRFIEKPLGSLQDLCRREGISTEVSPLLLDNRKAASFMPIYLDMVEHRVLIVDHNRFLQDRLRFVEKQMKKWGSQKRRVGDHWYWHICPNLKWGEEIDYDQL